MRSRGPLYTLHQNNIREANDEHHKLNKTNIVPLGCWEDLKA